MIKSIFNKMQVNPMIFLELIFIRSTKLVLVAGINLIWKPKNIFFKNAFGFSKALSKHALSE